MLYDDEKNLYFIGTLAICSWFLYFMIYFDDLTFVVILSGIAFILIATTIFFISVHVYHNVKSGQQLVIYSLLFIGFSLLLVWFNYAKLQTMFPNIFEPL
ncbi:MULTISPECIES: hypothetical protein [Halobacillus]|uniref:hypothetical protein n=1 Tax=Halobacillus TaxID=45667 RepID=UPI0009A8B2EA|nr:MULTISPECIES: hypothetical protein [Halobacillus]